MAERVLGVIGSARASGAVAAAAAATGAAIARAGWSLACGGLGGVMEAACRGHREARERGEAPERVRTIGIVPSHERESASAWVDFVVPTGIGFARNVLVVLTAQAVIAVGGESGTLSEIALAWQHGRPVCVLSGLGGLAEQLGLVGRTLDYRYARPIGGAATPEQAVAWCAAIVESTSGAASG